MKVERTVEFEPIAAIEEAREKPALSVVIPVSERYDNPTTLFKEYKEALCAAVAKIEFLYVLDGAFESAYKELRALQEAGEPIRIIRLTRRFGEATAIAQGAARAKADTLLVLPAYYQVEPSSLTTFVTSLGNDDLIVARRWPRRDSALNRIGTRVFHYLLRMVTRQPFHDVGCGVRLARRRVFDEINLYGDQHRFIAVLSVQRGFRVREVDLPQSREDPRVRVYRPGIYLRRVLDLIAVFFVVRFTKRPLRFFGLLGSGLFLIGLVSLSLLTFERLFLDVALADRPALLLAALLLVLGVQLFAIGLIGELIIFTHAKDFKEYTVAETVNMPAPRDESPRPSERSDPPRQHSAQH